MKRLSVSSFSALFVVIAVLVGVMVSARPAYAVPPKVEKPVPCCSITGFTPVDGLVSAREAATGRTFQFKVTDAALFKTLKVGQKVYADFVTKKVSLDGGVPCCNIK